MSDFGDSVGSAVTGGLFARALEPDSGARKPDPNQPENCLNCGTPLTGAYCHACGQRGHIHRTIGGFLHELLHGAFHFEGKFWRTLPMLVFRPGAITRRYIEGERARFVSPMALFLFGVFLMFAVFQAVGLSTPTDIAGEGEVGATIDTVRDEIEDEIAIIRQDIETQVASGAETAEQQARIEELQGTLTGLESVETYALDENFNLTVRATGIDWIDQGIIAKWRENPSLMLYKMQANSYKFSWMLIPISVPFVWLLFAWKRRFRGYDHAVFVTYSLSFMTLMFVTASIVATLGIDAFWPTIVVVFAAPIHLYKHLRGAYQLSRFSALWRLLVLSSFIWVVIALFLQLLIVLGAF